MWIYKNEPLEEVPENAYGYVYLITNNLTGRKYIGKKLFWFKKTKVVKGKKKRIKAFTKYFIILRLLWQMCVSWYQVVPQKPTKI